MTDAHHARHDQKLAVAGWLAAGLVHDFNNAVLVAAACLDLIADAPEDAASVREQARTAEARVEAAKRIGLLLHAHAGKLWADEEWQMDVTDDKGLIPFVINIAAMKSSATLLT